MADKWNDVKKTLPVPDDNRFLSWDGHYRSKALMVTFLDYFDGIPRVARNSVIYRDDGKWFWGDEEEGILDDVLVDIIA